MPDSTEDFSALALKRLQECGLYLSHDFKSLRPLTGRLTTDTRKVQAGDTFIAYRGLSIDSNQFAQQAGDAGAALVVLDDPTTKPPNFPFIRVKNGRAAWSHLAALVHQDPQKEFASVAFTGTNGKTSGVWLFREILRLLGKKSLSIGTLGIYFDEQFSESSHTTPDPEQFFEYLAKGKALGLKHLIMEASSHALSQEKLVPLTFAGAAFTSFSRDHLDFHGSMDEYFASKWRLFSERLAIDGRAVFSTGIPLQPKHSLPKDSWIYGPDAKAAASKVGARYLAVENLTLGLEGSTFTFVTAKGKVSGRIPVVGAHGVDNFAAAYLLAEKVTGEFLEPGEWPKIRPIPGRLARVAGGGTRSPGVFVDYAHTPDALEKSLLALRPLVSGRLTVVFGCGGDRDKGKRPMMAEVAERLADVVHVTSDNPRTEDPNKIIQEIVAGFKKKPKVEPDRAKAIEKAISSAGEKDAVLIAGKGHETYQIIGNVKHPFDDAKIASQALEAPRS